MSNDMKVWNYVRYSFGAIIACWVASIIYEELVYNTFFDFFWFAAVIFNFVNCIRHLGKYKQKTFAITSLVISSFLLLLMFIGFIVGVALTMAQGA